MSNTGFVDVVTQPAGRGSVSVPDLGTFALLAGPTVAPYGTVFLATLEGRVIALHPDGGPHWNYQLPADKITSSPVVGSDGSVYVVSDAGVVRDHRGGRTEPSTQAKLYKFSPIGGGPIVTDFPQHDRGPRTLGPPNVWQFDKDEAIMVPALYPTLGGTDLHLLAFSPNGGVMADWSLFLSGGDVMEGGSWDALLEKLTPFHFHPGTVGGPPPFPGVAIAAAPQGGTPFVMLVDRYFRQTIGFTFCVDHNGSCAPRSPGFTELFRTPHEPRRLWSAPMILPDMHTVVGTDDGAVFSGPSAVPMPAVTGLGWIYATPTLAANRDVVLVNDGGDVSVLRDGAVVSRVQLPGITMARAAVSRSHVFVSTTEALYTLDANAAASVFRFSWSGGGIWSPAIGPEGHVYAMASNVLFVFPPPRTHGDPHGLEALRGSLVSG
jgi:outer membrane protein assembly factor BamB